MPFHLSIRQDVERLRGSLAALPEPVSRPCLIIVGGLPGVGKSYFSRELAARVPAVIMESDTLRKILFARPTYTWQENRRLFEACHQLAEDLLRECLNVIFDATNLQEAHRQELRDLSERAGARTITVWVEARPELVRERMAARIRRHDPNDNSEADWGIYQRLSGTEQPPRRNYIRVNTARDITPVVEKIVRAVASEM